MRTKLRKDCIQAAVKKQNSQAWWCLGSSGRKVISSRPAWEFKSDMWVGIQLDDKALTLHGQGLRFYPQFHKNKNNRKKTCPGPKHLRMLGYNQEPKLKIHR